MRRFIVGLAAVVAVLLGQSVAYAEFNDWRLVRWTKNTVVYVFSPVNCPINYLKSNVQAHSTEKGDLWDLAGCVVDNANRNPANLEPIIQ